MVKLLSSVPLLLTALSTIAWAAPSATTTRPTQPHNTPIIHTPSSIKEDLSHIFGWQLSGTFLNQEIAMNTCKDLNSLGHGRWQTVGYDPPAIKTAICRTAKMSNEEAVASSRPEIEARNTQIFLHQIMSSFSGGPNNSAYKYLCSHVRPEMLDYFFVNGTEIREHLCTYAGYSPDGWPALKGSQLDPDRYELTNVQSQYIDNNTLLYAHSVSIAWETAADQYFGCSNFPYVDRPVAEMGFNPTLVRNLYCALKVPAPIKDFKSLELDFYTNMFALRIANMGNTADFHHFLCDHLNADGMGAVGIKSAAVRGAICPVSSSKDKVWG